MDFSTITFIAGLASCAVGIATFISGMNARAQKDGVLEQKINQAIEGIEEIKEDLKATSSNQASLALTVASHEEQIKTIFRYINTFDNRQQSFENQLNNQGSNREILMNILHILKERSE